MKKLDKFEIITVWVTFNPATRNSWPVFRWIILELLLIFKFTKFESEDLYESSKLWKFKILFRLSSFILYHLEKSYQEQKKTYSNKFKFIFGINK